LSTSGNNPETSFPTVIEAITRLIASFRGSRYCELRSARSSLHRASRAGWSAEGTERERGTWWRRGERKGKGKGGL